MINSQVKVLYLFCYENHSGAELVMKRLIDANKFVKPIVICPPGNFSALLRSSNIEVIERESLRPLQWMAKRSSRIKIIFDTFRTLFKLNWEILRILTKEKINIVHANNVNASFFVLPLVILLKLFFTKKRFIWSNHDLNYRSGKFAEYVSKLCVKFFDTTITVSEAVKNKYMQSKNIVVLYNGLNTKLFQHDETKRLTFRKKFNFSNQNIVIAIIGSVIPHKGHLMIINAFLSLLPSYSDIRLLIVGRYENENMLKDVINAKIGNLTPGLVQVLSHTDDIHTVYNGIDLVTNCTLPGVGEPLGTTIYEGMAYEKIVLVSDTGGSSEIVSDGHDGYLFEPGNLASLIVKLKDIIENYASMDSIRKQARAKVLNKFNIDNMVSNYNNIILTLH